MAEPAVLQKSYERAMRRDGAREAMPPGSVWSLIDYIPEIMDARLRKRGGYVYASQDINAVQGTASFINGGVVADFSDGQSVLAFDEDGRVYEVESASSTENIGAALLPWKPVLYQDKLIVPDVAGATGPKKITRAAGAHTIAALGGSPPAGSHALVYKDVVWLGASTALPRRTYFSVAGNPESWDTTTKYIDNSYNITGYAALANAVLIFSRQRTTRVRGSIPPPDSDFQVDDPVFNVGCTSPRSIANWRDKVIFANGQGIYITDGVAVEDLTKLCGMKSWWRDVMAGREGFATGTAYDINTWAIPGGIYDDYYFYSIVYFSGGVSTLVDSGMIDLGRFAWMRLSGLDSTGFFERLYPQELFFGRGGAARVGRISDIFAPTGTNKNDANGTAVLPVIEYPFFMAQPGQKTAMRVYLGYDLRDAASDNPTLRVSYTPTPESTTYTALTPDLGETTAYQRTALQLDAALPGVGIKVAQLAASSDTRLYDLETDMQGRERSR
jgi:hypothetical protein